MQWVITLRKIRSLAYCLDCGPEFYWSRPIRAEAFVVCSNEQLLLRPKCCTDVQSVDDCVIHASLCDCVINALSLVDPIRGCIGYELLQSLWRNRHTQSSGG